MKFYVETRLWDVETQHDFYTTTTVEAENELDALSEFLKTGVTGEIIEITSENN